MLRKKIDPSTTRAGGRKPKYTVSEARELKRQACLLKQQSMKLEVLQSI